MTINRFLAVYVTTNRKARVYQACLLYTSPSPRDM